jgi:DNA-binding transcriptional MerR regulator
MVVFLKGNLIRDDVSQGNSITSGNDAIRKGDSMENSITIKEMIGALKSEGMGLTREQLWSYIDKGILPLPRLDRNGEAISVYPLDMIAPLRRLLALRDRGVPLAKAKAILMEENLLFVSDLFKKKGVNVEKIYHFALPNIEVDEQGGMKTDRGFSGFFIDLLETTLWRSGEQKEEQALLTLHRQLLKWKASMEAFWEKFEKVEPGDSWEGKRTKISQAYSEVITTLNG